MQSWCWIQNNRIPSGAGAARGESSPVEPQQMFRRNLKSLVELDDQSRWTWDQFQRWGQFRWTDNNINGSAKPCQKIDIELQRRF